jgi:hypothetical protein
MTDDELVRDVSIAHVGSKEHEAAEKEPDGDQGSEQYGLQP